MRMYLVAVPCRLRATVFQGSEKAGVFVVVDVVLVDDIVVNVVNVDVMVADAIIVDVMVVDVVSISTEACKVE